MYQLKELSKVDADDMNVHHQPKLVAVILVRHAEKYDADIFGEVINLAVRIDLRVHFILFHSDYCPLKLHTSQIVQSLLPLSIVQTMSPFSLYDEFMARVLTARKIPVLLPAALIESLHESFWRSTGCVTTTLDK